MATNYTTDVRTTRLSTSTVPTLTTSIDQVDQARHIFAVHSTTELDTIATEYGSTLIEGDIAVFYDAFEMPVKLYAWSGSTLKWQILPSLSITGPVLVNATTADKGIVQYAELNEEAALKSVQANDPRLNREWIAQATAPINTSVLWIDTSIAEPTIKWFDGSSWKIISNKKLIDDVLPSSTTAYSSNKINSLLMDKAEALHNHLNYDSHIVNKNNPHDVRATQIQDFDLEVSNNVDVLANTTARHSHSNKLVIDALADAGGELYYKSKIVGKGDMIKSIYDTNNDGIVDKAAVITDGTITLTPVSLQNAVLKAHVHGNKPVLDATEESFTTALKNKLDLIADEANNYIHPDTHSASMIDETIERKFVSQSQIALWGDKYTKLEIDNLLVSKESTLNKGKANGYASLDTTGKVPITQIPLTLKETKIAANMTELETIQKYAGLRVVVADTSDDPRFGPGTAELVWSGTQWLLVHSTSTKGLVVSNNLVEIKIGVEADRSSNPPADGTLFMAMDTRKIYLYYQGKCLSFTSNIDSSSGVPGIINRVQETIFLPAGQVTINLLEGSYAPGQEDIVVWINGIQQPGSAYIEYSNTQVVLKAPIPEDSMVAVEYIAE